MWTLQKKKKRNETTLKEAKCYESKKTGSAALSTPWFFQIPVCVGVVSTNHLLGNFPAVLRKVTLEECSGCLKRLGIVLIDGNHAGLCIPVE